MTVRVDLLRKEMISLDNVVLKQGDVVQFKDISELDPPIPERMALLKISTAKEIIPHIGTRLDDNTYIVQEL